MSTRRGPPKSSRPAVHFTDVSPPKPFKGHLESFFGVTHRRQAGDKKSQQKPLPMSELDKPWDGDKRLQQVFQFPILEKFAFQHEDDEDEWIDFIRRYRQFVYCPEKHIHDYEWMEKLFLDVIRWKGYESRKQYDHFFKSKEYDA
ncbi:uncharacterized protein KNAG_0D03345 [Huiozyma naganishii CBS 8797]|uniref:Uncharacterized protein n=1 Tax=Huiozyma naganishii (strain ATCC MYA-139 / BCRC 22969 / CBS 8797 / KCTC 17520 / NBRC 10181 / NCYC 3082 / Yp74L-3) TaxID=1071383 RepID=J7S734_HUIN7|nr:hypothetical protein KNAG_0D03345 [Kazachstania naganishii CBS 8797]CCK70081.1 hypothetical protein KNAG_0D03345 [Kazachstania naganishii CBS 8797]